MRTGRRLAAAAFSITPAVVIATPAMSSAQVEEPPLTDDSDIPEDVRGLPYRGRIEIKCCLNTQRFITNRGRVCISTSFRRDNIGTPNTLTATMYRDDVFIDENRGARTLSTTSDDSACWDIGNSEHYIRFEKRDDGVYVRGSFKIAD